MFLKNFKKAVIISAIILFAGVVTGIGFEWNEERQVRFQNRLDPSGLHKLQKIAGSPGETREFFGLIFSNNARIVGLELLGTPTLGFQAFLINFYNGFALGRTIVGLAHARRALGSNVYLFVLPHSFFEFTAMVLAGAPGICLGLDAAAFLRREQKFDLTSRFWFQLLFCAATSLILVLVGALFEAFYMPGKLIEIVR